MKATFVWGFKTQGKIYVPSSTFNQSREACLELARATISEKETLDIVRVMHIGPKER